MLFSNHTFLGTFLVYNKMLIDNREMITHSAFIKHYRTWYRVMHRSCFFSCYTSKYHEWLIFVYVIAFENDWNCRAVPCRNWFWSIPKNEIYLKWLHGRFGMNQPRGLRHDLDLADFGPDFAQIWPFLTQKVTLGSQKKLQNVFEMALWTIWYEPTARIKTWPRFSRFWPKFCPNLALFGPKSHPGESKNFKMYSKWLHGRFGMNQPRGLRHDLDLADFGPIFAQIWPFLAQKVTLRGSNKPELISE